MSEDDHIVKSFGEDLEQLKAEVFLMGDIVFHQYVDAIKCLKNWDDNLYSKIMNLDKEVNASEEKIIERVTNILALRQPVAIDLRQALTALRIAQDLERIGDCAQNIVRRGSRLPKDLFSNGHLMASEKDAIYSLFEHCEVQLKGTLQSYKDEDTDEAIRMWLLDDKLDGFYALAVKKLVAQMTSEESLDFRSFSHFLLLLKDVERIGDHATNIAEGVHYLVKGATLEASLPPWATEK